MRPRVRLLRLLLDAGIYVADERAVADAIIARARLRRCVPEIRFMELGASLSRQRNLPGALPPSECPPA